MTFGKAAFSDESPKRGTVGWVRAFVVAAALLAATPSPAQVVRAYLATREVFGHVSLWQQVEALDDKVPDQVQSEMLIEEGWLTARATTWSLRSRRLAEHCSAQLPAHLRELGCVLPVGSGVDDRLGSLGRILAEEDTAPHENRFRPERHAERRIGGSSDSTRGEQNYRRYGRHMISRFGWEWSKAE